MKTRIFAIFCLFASVSLSAEPPTAAAIERLMKLTDVYKMVEVMQQQVAGTVDGLMNQANKGKVLTPEQQERLNAARAEIVSRCEAQVTWEKMRAAYVPLYQATFTQEEVDGMISFYESPAGRAFMTKMPNFMKSATSIMKQQLVPVMALAQESTAKAAASINH
jgi:uncharacterized protein